MVILRSGCRKGINGIWCMIGALWRGSKLCQVEKSSVARIGALQCGLEGGECRGMFWCLREIESERSDSESDRLKGESSRSKSEGER